MFYIRNVLKSFAKFVTKHLCRDLILIKLQASVGNFIKKRTLTQSCFPVNFTKVTENFLWNTFRRLYLMLSSQTIFPIKIKFSEFHNWPKFNKLLNLNAENVARRKCRAHKRYCKNLGKLHEIFLTRHFVFHICATYD